MIEFIILAVILVLFLGLSENDQIGFMVFGMLAFCIVCLVIAGWLWISWALQNIDVIIQTAIHYVITGAISLACILAGIFIGLPVYWKLGDMVRKVKGVHV